MLFVGCLENGDRVAVFSLVNIANLVMRHGGKSIKKSEPISLLSFRLLPNEQTVSPIYRIYFR